MEQWVKAIIKLSVRLTMGTLMEARLLRVHGRRQRSAHEAQYGVEQVKSVFLTQKNQRFSRVTKCNEGRPYLASKNSLTLVKLYSCDWGDDSKDASNRGEGCRNRKDELGFFWRGLTMGWKSLKRSPGITMMTHPRNCAKKTTHSVLSNICARVTQET